MIHCSWLLEACSSSTSRGMATFRIVLSITITSRLTHSAASVHQRLAYQGSSAYDALAVEVMVPALICGSPSWWCVARSGCVSFDTQRFRNSFYPELPRPAHSNAGDARHVRCRD